MKLRYKLIIPLIYSFIILFISASITLISINYRKNLDKEIINRAYLFNNVETKIIIPINYTIPDYFDLNVESISLHIIKSIDEIKSKLNVSSLWYEIYFSKEVPYKSNLEEPIKSISTFDEFNSQYSIDDETLQYIIENNFLYLYKSIQIETKIPQKIILVLVFDIEEIKENRNWLFFAFGITGLIIVFCFIIISWFITKELIKPLEELTARTEIFCDIDSQNYHLKKTDEI